MTDITPEDAAISAVSEVPTRRHARGGGRAANQRRGGPAVRQMPWTDVINVDKPTEPIPHEGVLAIHDAAMRILEDIGARLFRQHIARGEVQCGRRHRPPTLGRHVREPPFDEARRRPPPCERDDERGGDHEPPVARW